MVHNAYQQAGGEDAVMNAEKDLLLRAGNDVNQYLRHNNEIKSGDACSNITLGLRTVWSSGSRNELHPQLKQRKPDVVHFHNTFRSSRLRPITPAGNSASPLSRHSTITAYSAQQAPFFAMAKCVKTASPKTAGKQCDMLATGNRAALAQRLWPCSLFTTGTAPGRSWSIATSHFLSSRARSLCT